MGLAGVSMKKLLNPHLFLETIRNNDKYRQQLIEVAPTIKEDILSFLTNPKCGCRGRIQKYVIENITKEPIDKLLEEMQKEVPRIFLEVNDKSNTSTTQGVNATVSIQAFHTKSMKGHVVEIPATPAEYQELLKVGEKENWEYKGASVMERKNLDGETVWLVFFY
jgi:hypothetical protein